MLTIYCLNGFRVTDDDQPLTRFYSQKTRALLIYLAVEGGRAHERSHLAGLLWPDYSEARARRNLSQTLTALRKDLGEKAAASIQSDTRNIELQQGPNLSVDVLQLEDGLSSVRQHQHANPLTCPICTATLQEMADLYLGPFLEQFSVGDSSIFENWVESRREQYRQQIIEVLTHLSNSYAAQSDLAIALETNQRLLSLAPWQESTHQQRMMLLAQNNQRIHALAQYETLADILMEEFGVAPSAESDALYDRILAGDVEVAPAGHPPETTPPPQLPPPYQAPNTTPHFVGRQDELSKIQEIIGANSHGPNYIALVGMGGIGKSAFAAHIANQLTSEFPDGILWGNVKTSDSHNILNLWASAYGNDYSGLNDLESKASAVRSLLATKRVLLVIDNIDEAADARPLLPNGEHCLLLMTTRNLDIATTLNAHPILLSELNADMSQQLIVKILGKERVFKNQEESDAAIAIGELLHHLPLAVEIAAKRLLSRPRMPLASLARRFEDMQQRLGLAISDQAVRTSFQMSWEGLSPTGQQLFAAMGVFKGLSFSLEGIIAVSDLDPFDAEDELLTLVALSLVGEDSETRYRQHPLLADFAMENLSGSVAQHTERLATFYLVFAQKHYDQVEVLTPEWNALNLAIQAAYDLQQWQTVIEFTNVLATSWLKYGRFHDALRNYPLASSAAERLQSDESLAKTYLRWAEIDIEQSNYDSGWERVEAALALYYQLEDDVGVAKSKYFQGFILHDQGLFKEAQEVAIETVQLEAQLNNSENGSLAAALLAWIYYQTEATTEKAAQAAQQAIELLGDSSNDAAMIPTLNILAAIALRDKELASAEEYAQRSLALSTTLKLPAEIANSQQLLVTIYIQQRNFEAANELAHQNLQLLRAVGNKRTEAMLLRQLGQAHLVNEELHQAKHMSEQAMALYTEIKDRLGYGYSLRQLGDIYKELDQPAEAQKQWEEAAAIAEHLDHAQLRKQVAARLTKSQD